MPEEALWPLAVYFGAVLALVAFVLGASAVLGESHHERATGDPFESGALPVRPARLRFDAKFFIVAVLFVIFDLETVYVLTWAVVARTAGWAAYIEIAIFIGILLAGLAYLWRVGALDWGTRAGGSGEFADRPRRSRSARTANPSRGLAARQRAGSGAALEGE